MSETLLPYMNVIPTFRVVLGSQSPRRLNLLRLMGFRDIEVYASDAESSPNGPKFNPNNPKEYVTANAVMKGKDVAAKCFHFDILIAADTIVVHEHQLIQKPSSNEDAQNMLYSLAGLQKSSPSKSHDVYTGVAIFFRNSKVPSITLCTKTEVIFGALAQEDIDAYVATGDSQDKAGAYGIQTVGCLLIEKIQGCYYNVQGLPVYDLSRAIARFLKNNYDIHKGEWNI